MPLFSDLPTLKPGEDDEDSEDDFEVKLGGEPEGEDGKNSLKRKPELISAEEPAKKKKKKRPEKCKVLFVHFRFSHGTRTKGRMIDAYCLPM